MRAKPGGILLHTSAVCHMFHKENNQTQIQVKLHQSFVTYFTEKAKKYKFKYKYISSLSHISRRGQNFSNDILASKWYQWVCHYSQGTHRYKNFYGTLSNCQNCLDCQNCSKLSTLSKIVQACQNC